MILGENISKVYNKGKEIQKVYSYGKLVWEKQSSEDIDYSTTPFTITAVADDVRVKLNGSGSFSFNYKKNNSDWLSCNTGEYINLKENDVIYISALPPSNSKVSSVNISGLADVSGNIMSLCYGDDFVGKTELQKDSIFSGFFRDCDIRNAKNLILPATTLVYSCYIRMFYMCDNLITAPELPATTLADYCYENMFYMCYNLTTAPELPATTLASYCYSNMFRGCRSLTQAPELPATTLASYCYYYMLSGCDNLTTAPELPATTLANNCYENMFYACDNLTTAPELPATTLANNCYTAMFQSCTSLTQAPELPATTLYRGCYSYMFNGCKSLTTAPELPATTLITWSYHYMFQNCSNINYIKCYAQYNITSGISEFLKDVSPTGKLVCYEEVADAFRQYIPSGWTVEYID
jgi:hypothetical protein